MSSRVTASKTAHEVSLRERMDEVRKVVKRPQYIGLEDSKHVKVVKNFLRSIGRPY